MNKDNGKWFSIKLTNDESTAVERIKESLQQCGMNQPFTAIIRRLMTIGSDNVNWDDLISNPMSLWMENQT